MSDDLEAARARREERESQYARRLADALFPPIDPRYRRAIQRAKQTPAQPVHACTSAAIDAGMFWMEHGYYPGETPALTKRDSPDA